MELNLLPTARDHHWICLFRMLLKARFTIGQAAFCHCHFSLPIAKLEAQRVCLEPTILGVALNKGCKERNPFSSDSLLVKNLLLILCFGSPKRAPHNLRSNNGFAQVVSLFYPSLVSNPLTCHLVYTILLDGLFRQINNVTFLGIICENCVHCVCHFVTLCRNLHLMNV